MIRINKLSCSQLAAILLFYCTASFESSLSDSSLNIKPCCRLSCCWLVLLLFGKYYLPKNLKKKNPTNNNKKSIAWRKNKLWQMGCFIFNLCAGFDVSWNTCTPLASCCRCRCWLIYSPSRQTLLCIRKAYQLFSFQMSSFVSGAILNSLRVCLSKPSGRMEEEMMEKPEKKCRNVWSLQLQREPPQILIELWKLDGGLFFFFGQRRFLFSFSLF